MEATEGSVGSCRGGHGKGIIAGSGYPALQGRQPRSWLGGEQRHGPACSDGAEEAEGRAWRVMNAAFICLLEGLWGRAEPVPSSKRAEPGRPGWRPGGHPRGVAWAATPDPASGALCLCSAEPSRTGWGGRARGKLSPVDPTLWTLRSVEAQFRASSLGPKFP